jgi:uncharacterized protein
MCRINGQADACLASSQNAYATVKIECMVPKDLLDILVCPACKQPLALNSESLKCNACRRVYPIRDNIPILLIDEAVIDPA